MKKNSWKPVPGVPSEVRKFLSKAGSKGGLAGSRVDKVRAGKKVKKKSRQLAAAITNNKLHGTPIPEALIHGKAPKV